jgi:pimeloyl-ACP methyl ester carboxylesterase
MRRVLLPSLCAAALTAILLPASPAAADTEPPSSELDSATLFTATLDSADLMWGPCDEDEGLEPDDPAECATLEVPLDWDEPEGETIEIALARRQAEDPGERIGVLIDMPGGPWGSGVTNVLHGNDRFSDELYERFDVVGFDPRGSGRSTPILCSAELLAEAPAPVMADKDAFAERAAYNEELRDDCREHTGELFDHASSLHVVHDLEAIRMALGEEQLSFYGVSYGTLLGQQYPEYYPEGVRAFALDSVMNHDLDTRAFLHTQGEAMQVSFDEFVSWCEDAEACALHGEGDVREFWHDLLDSADAGEITDPSNPEAVLGPDDIIEATFGYYYTPDWADLADLLHALAYGEADQDELSLLAAPSAQAVAPSRQEDPNLEVYPYPSVLCADYSLPVNSFGHWSSLMRQVERKSAPDVRYGPLAVSDVANCMGFDSVTNPQAPADVDVDPPLLIGNSLYDPPTGYNWATALDEQLGDSGRLLTYEGWGHGIYRKGSPCVIEAYDRYLIDLELPEQGATCAPVPPEPESAQEGTPFDAESLPPAEGTVLPHLTRTG